jgi:hypothetical protein
MIIPSENPHPVVGSYQAHGVVRPLGVFRVATAIRRQDTRECALDRHHRRQGPGQHARREVPEGFDHPPADVVEGARRG